jgi:hypothetical protein
LDFFTPEGITVEKQIQRVPALATHTPFWPRTDHALKKGGSGIVSLKYGWLGDLSHSELKALLWLLVNV